MSASAGGGRLVGGAWWMARTEEDERRVVEELDPDADPLPLAAADPSDLVRPDHLEPSARVLSLY